MYIFVNQRWTAAILIEDDQGIFEEIWRAKKINLSIEIWWIAGNRYEFHQFLGGNFETHRFSMFETLPHDCKWSFYFSTNLLHSIWSFQCVFILVSSFNVCTAGPLLQGLSPDVNIHWRHLNTVMLSTFLSLKNTTSDSQNVCLKKTRDYMCVVIFTLVFKRC